MGGLFFFGSLLIYFFHTLLLCSPLPIMEYGVALLKGNYLPGKLHFVNLTVTVIGFR